MVVLPAATRQQFDLPEAVTVTSDPDVARDEGALLLVPGHSLLDAAVARVLDQRDAGTLWLEWPRRQPPAREDLLALARDQVGVEHGRIDAEGEPLPRYAPVLRVGAQVTFHVDDRFHERDEVWVDARSGLVAPHELVERLPLLPRHAGRPDHLALDADLGDALAAAHRLLDERARARLAVLGRQAEPAMRDELAQAERFYEAALESIARRRASAQPERRSLYDAQADATRAERERRLQEIREKFEAEHEIRPVRLHLVQVPALHLPVVVRRGPRTFPFALTWWQPVGRFAGVRCPSCGEPAPLVAAKDRLGCQSCLARPQPALVTAPAPPRAPSPEPPPSETRPAPERKPAPAPEQRRPSRAELDARAAAELEEWRRNLAKLRSRVLRIGNELGYQFWESVGSGDSWARKRTDPASPLGVLFRLYGAEGPLRGIGVPPGAVVEGYSADTQEPEPDLPCTTCGAVAAGGDRYVYSLRWRLAGGKPVLLEVTPWPWTEGARLAPLWGMPPAIVRQLLHATPTPRIELDPVAAALWREERPRTGIAAVARCLAAWWRVEHDPQVAGHSPEVIAAALAALIGYRAGRNRTRPAAAADYGVDVTEVVSAARKLQAALGLSPTCWW